MSKTQLYDHLTQQLEALLSDERDFLANAANTAALLYHTLPEVNWAGFYFLRGDGPDEELVVGPFQGKPACTRIALGKGVCGTAAREQKTTVVADVHQFPGHIACDAASKSEIVVPVMDGSHCLGEIDIDSDITDAFAEPDQVLLEGVASRITPLMREMIPTLHPHG